MASTNEIEREVETQRAQVEHTLDALKNKMSFGQIVDEVGGYVGTEDAGAALRNAGRQVRDNPIAFGLVGVGLAWLMLGGGGRSRGDADWDGGWDDVDRSRRAGRRDAGGYPGAPGGVSYGSSYGSPYPGGMDLAGRGPDHDHPSEGSALGRAARSVGEAVSDVGERLSGAVSGIGATVSNAASGVGDGVSNAAGGLGERLSDARHAGERRLRRAGDDLSGYAPAAEDVRRYGRRMRSTLEETMERQPLLVGAVAVAIGAAIGAALPNTRMEDRLLGDRRDDLMAEAKRTAQELGDEAVAAASAGLEAASRTAEEEGLTPDPEGKTLAARVETVVRSGVEGVRERLDDDRSPEPANAGKTA